MIRTILYPVTFCEAVIFDFTEEQNNMIKKMTEYEKAKLLFNNLTEEEQLHTSLTRIYEYFNAGLSKMEPLKGVCHICGCCADNACSNPTHGNCWWIDETETLCSHCAYEEIKSDPATKGPSGVRVLSIDTEKLLDTKQQIYVFIDKDYQGLFEEIVKECNIQIIKKDANANDIDIGFFYTLELANMDEVYWFGRNYQNAINEFRKTK